MATETKKKLSYDFSSSDLLIFTWNKRIPLAIITIIAAIASTIASFMITEKFRSSVVMFPTADASISRSLLGQTNPTSRMYQIGMEEQSEQLMQVLHSSRIRDRVIEKFDLMDHYEIDRNSEYPMTELYAAYESNVSFRITRYLSVVIEVMDADPQMSADIANFISDMVDTVYVTMMRERAVEAYEIMKFEKQDVENTIDSLKEEIEFYRDLGINHIVSQLERYNEGYANALVENNDRAESILEEKVNMITDHQTEYTLLRDMIYLTNARSAELDKRLAEARIEATQTLPHKFTVDRAYPAEKKAYPKKSIIVIISTLAAFLMGLILLIIRDNVSKKVAA